MLLHSSFFSQLFCLLLGVLREANELYLEGFSEQLHSLNLENYLQSLQHLGAHELAHVEDVEDDDLKLIGMKPAQMKRLRRAITEGKQHVIGMPVKAFSEVEEGC